MKEEEEDKELEEVEEEEVVVVEEEVSRPASGELKNLEGISSSCQMGLRDSWNIQQ